MGHGLVVKWSAFSPSTLTIRVQIPLQSASYCKIIVEKNENKQKEAAWVSPLKINMTYKFLQVPSV